MYLMAVCFVFFLVFADPLLGLHPCMKPGSKLLNRDSFCPHSYVFVTQILRERGIKGKRSLSKT